MSLMMDILENLAPLNRLPCAQDYDRAVDYLRNLLTFNVIDFDAAEEYNGWVIPPKCTVLEAKILKDGRLIYDGLWHPLAVIALSAAFQGRVSLAELKQHLHYDSRYRDSLTFHFRQQFRSWSRDWGFCVSRDLYDSLTEGEYEVTIRTEEEPGVMRVLEYTHPGRLGETMAIYANLDHPGVANDGISGVAVGVELMKRLAEKKTKYTYRLVLAPGIVGAEYYLGRKQPAERDSFLECLCLWMLGSRTQLALQESRDAQSNLERALEDALRAAGTPHRRGAFESIVINDEYVWEAYGIPACSLSRMPYPEYHSSRDSMAIMREESLSEAVDVVENAIDTLEKTLLVRRKFTGTICLSNPRYDLYVDPGQIAFGESITNERKRLRLLMDTLPTLTRPITTRALANRVDLPEEPVVEYLQKWADKGLIELL